MKVEVGQDHIKLLPESHFEQQALDRLCQERVVSISFEDQWNRAGGLIVNFSSNDRHFDNTAR